MKHASGRNFDRLVALLQDRRVIQGINAQCTYGIFECHYGMSALHLACQENPNTSVIQLLFLHGSNSFLPDAKGQTPLDILRQSESATLNSLGRAMETTTFELQRLLLLTKARKQIDTHQPVPPVSSLADVVADTNAQAQAETATAQAEALTPAEIKVIEKQRAVLNYVLRDRDEYPEPNTGMVAELFEELKLMMAPTWDMVPDETIEQPDLCGPWFKESMRQTTEKYERSLEQRLHWQQKILEMASRVRKLRSEVEEQKLQLQQLEQQKQQKAP